MNTRFLKHRLATAELPAEWYIHELGYKNPVTFWRQIRTKKIKISKLERLFHLLDFTLDEMSLAMTAEG